jgi:hypothetical protein
MTVTATDGKITAPAGSVTSGDDGGDVAQQDPTQRDPATIQREIEETRAELADTIDAIADRMSPRRAAGRGAAAVKSSMAGLFGGNGSANGAGAPRSVLDAGPAAAGKVDTNARQRAVESVARAGGGAAYTGTSEFHVERRLRVDRVLLAVGVAAAVAGAVVLWRSRD